MNGRTGACRNCHQPIILVRIWSLDTVPTRAGATQTARWMPLGARPMDPAWVRDLRDQAAHDPTCAFLLKQWGEWAPRGTAMGANLRDMNGHERRQVGAPDSRGFRVDMARVGKKTAGRELDGRTWDAFPGGAA